jgi:transcriptional regulator with XRE-family HTH domain
MAGLKFGPRVKKARVRQGLTQKELGKKLHPRVSQATISQWETEFANPSDDYRTQLRRILGWSSSDSEAKSVPGSENAESIESPSAIGAWLNRTRLEQKLSVPELADKAGLSAVALYNIESGRSQSPQRKTVAKLERHLGSNYRQRPKKRRRPRQRSRELANGLILTRIPKLTGQPWREYMFCTISVTDPGQGQNISTRLRDHHQKFWFRPPIVQNAAFAGIDNKELREQIEKVLIKFLKSNAVLNQQNVDR